jgi:DNA (cytosine-5)-methyltransferase 1
MMTVGSLFSGIGGIDLGLERAGMQIRWQVENDPYCNRILAKHWPDVKRYGDIRSLDWSQVERVNLLSGGFPCQPVSQGGLQKGSSDERWMWPDFYNAICEINPDWVLAENVPGLLSIESGQLFGSILRDLAEMGYDAEWGSLPSAAFGTHFRGERVYVIANRSQANCLRRKGEWQNPMGSTFSRAEFERLVQREIQLCVPAGKSQRVSDGISGRVDRLRALGNAVIPQVAEYLGGLIVSSSRESASGKVKPDNSQSLVHETKGRCQR